MMLPAVFALLKASTQVKAIVGTNPPRIWRHGWAPQKPDAQPQDEAYVTWQMISGVPENTLSELPLSDRQTVQLDCWHPTDAGVENLAIAVRDALEPHGVMTGAPLDLREPDTKLYRMSLQFDFFVDR